MEEVEGVEGAGGHRAAGEVGSEAAEEDGGGEAGGERGGEGKGEEELAGEGVADVMSAEEELEDPGADDGVHHLILRSVWQKGRGALRHSSGGRLSPCLPLEETSFSCIIERKLTLITILLLL